MGQGGYPVRYPPRGGTWPGTPPGGSGYPPGGVPDRVPPGGGTQVGQQKEYSLHGGRYASCVHAGGLSCYFSFENCYVQCELYSCRFNQNVTLNNVQNEFVLEIPIKGNISCSSVIFGLRRLVASCGSMYFRESDCEMLETLPNEESCYVRCYCNNGAACDGKLIVNVERDERKWAVCTMLIAWKS